MIAKWVKKYSRSLDNAIFFIIVGVTGLLWGICYASLMAIRGEYKVKMLMIICTVGLCASGIVAFIPSINLSLFYNFALLTPTVVILFIRRSNLSLACLILVCNVYMVFMAKRGNREYFQALENEKLLIRKSEEMHLLAQIDGLTGLYNRRYFNENMDREFKKSARVRTPPIVMIADIDHFKRINDQYGHLAGDEFLKSVANLLKKIFRRETDIVARFGGEEFIVLLTDSTPQIAFALAEELRRAMSDMQVACNGVSISATMSIGIACSQPGLDESRDALISRADNALYLAKKHGRNQTVAAAPGFSWSQESA